MRLKLFKREQSLETLAIGARAAQEMRLKFLKKKQSLESIAIGAIGMRSMVDIFKEKSLD